MSVRPSHVYITQFYTYECRCILNKNKKEKTNGENREQIGFLTNFFYLYFFIFFLHLTQLYLISHVDRDYFIRELNAAIL